jgi:peroxiredoxin
LAVLARDHERYAQRGAAIIGISVDSPGQNAAMAQKLALPFPLLSDPDATGAIAPFGVADAGNARGVMAKPAIVVVAPNGGEAYRYAGGDFADRPGDAERSQRVDGAETWRGMLRRLG